MGIFTCTFVCTRRLTAYTHTHSVNSKGHLLHLQVLASAVAARQLVQAQDFFLVFVFQKGENGGEGKCKGGEILASTVSFELLLNY